MPCWHVNTRRFRSGPYFNLSFELCRNSSPCYTPHVSQPILNQRPQDTLQTSIRKFSSHTCLFWTLPEQITPRMCANPEPMLQRYTTKPQTPRFSSHTSLFWTLPEQLSILHHACVPTPWTNVPRHTTNFKSENVHLTHPCFELCRNNSEQMTPRMCANPEPTFQRYTAKPQTLRFSSHTSLFWTLPEQPSTLNHACVPTHPEPTSQDTLQTSNPKMFISHIPVLNFAGTTRNRLHHACVPTHPAPTSQDTLQTSDPNFFISHIPVLNFAGTTRNRWHRARMCANPSWTKAPKTHHKTLDPKIFISHIPLPEQPSTLNHACVPTHPEPTSQNTLQLQIRIFSSHTSLFWTLPEQLAMLHHACEPTHPVPTSQDTTQTTNESILQTHPHRTSQDTPLKISMFTV